MLFVATLFHRSAGGSKETVLYVETQKADLLKKLGLTLGGSMIQSIQYGQRPRNGLSEYETIEAPPGGREMFDQSSSFLVETAMFGDDWRHPPIDSSQPSRWCWERVSPRAHGLLRLKRLNGIC